MSPPSPDYPESFVKDPHPRAAVNVRVMLPSGESVSGTLIDLDPFDVAMLDASGWYHSYSRDEVKLEIHDQLQAHREMMPKYTDADMHNMLAYLETLK